VEEKSIEEVLGVKNYSKLLDGVSSLHHAVEENYPSRTVVILFDNVSFIMDKIKSKSKLKEVI